MENERGKLSPSYQALGMGSRKSSLATSIQGSPRSDRVLSRKMSVTWEDLSPTGQHLSPGSSYSSFSPMSLETPSPRVHQQQALLSNCESEMRKLHQEIESREHSDPNDPFLPELRKVCKVWHDQMTSCQKAIRVEKRQREKLIRSLQTQKESVEVEEKELAMEKQQLLLKKDEYRQKLKEVEKECDTATAVIDLQTELHALRKRVDDESKKKLDTLVGIPASLTRGPSAADIKKDFLSEVMADDSTELRHRLQQAEKQTKIDSALIERFHQIIDDNNTDISDLQLQITLLSDATVKLNETHKKEIAQYESRQPTTTTAELESTIKDLQLERELVSDSTSKLCSLHKEEIKKKDNCIAELRLESELVADATAKLTENHRNEISEMESQVFSLQHTDIKNPTTAEDKIALSDLRQELLQLLSDAEGRVELEIGLTHNSTLLQRTLNKLRDAQKALNGRWVDNNNNFRSQQVWSERHQNELEEQFAACQQCDGSERRIVTLHDNIIKQSDSHNKEKESLQAHLSEIEKNHTSLLNQKNSEIDNERRCNEELKAEMEKLRNSDTQSKLLYEIQHLQGELCEINNRQNDSLKKISLLEETNTTLIDENKNHLTSIEESDSEVQRLQEQLSSSNEQHDGQVQVYQSELSQLQIEIDDLKKSNSSDTKKSSYPEIMFEVSTPTEDGLNNTVNNTIEEDELVEVKKLKKISNGVDVDCEYKKTINQQQLEIKKLKIEITRLELKSAVFIPISTPDINVNGDDSQKIVKQQQSEIKKLKNEISRFELQTLTATPLNSEIDLEELKLENESLKANLCSAQQQLKEMESSHSNEISRMQTQIECSNTTDENEAFSIEKYQLLKDERDSLAGKLKSKKDELLEIRNACNSEQDRHVDELRNMQIKLEAASKNTSAEGDDNTSEEVQRLQSEKDKLTSKVKSKKEKLAAVRNSLNEIQDRHTAELRDMEMKLEAASKTADETAPESDPVQQLQKENITLTKELSSKKDELLEIRNAYNSEQDRHVDELRNMQIKLEAASKNTSAEGDDNTSEEVQRLQSEKDKLTSKVKSKKEKLAAVRNSLNEIQDRHTAELRDMEMKLEAASPEVLVKLQEENTSLKDLSEQLRSESNDEVEKCKSEITHLRETLKEALISSKDFPTVKADLDLKSTELTRLQSQYNTLKQQRQEVKKGVDMNEFMELTFRHDSLSKENIKLKRANIELAAEIADIRSQNKTDFQLPIFNKDVDVDQLKSTHSKPQVDTIQQSRSKASLNTQITELYSKVEQLTSVGVLHHYEKEAFLEEIKTLTESNSDLVDQNKVLRSQIQLHNESSKNISTAEPPESPPVSSPVPPPVPPPAEATAEVQTPSQSPPSQSPSKQSEPKQDSEELRISREIDRKVKEERNRIALDRLRAEASVERAIREHQQSKSNYINGREVRSVSPRSISPARNAEYIVRYRPTAVSPPRMRSTLNTNPVGPPLTAEAHAFRREVAEVKKAVVNSQSPLKNRHSPSRSPVPRFQGRHTSPLKSILSSSPRSPSATRISRLSTRRQDWDQRHGEFEDNVSLLKAQLEGLSDAMKESTLAAHELSDKWKTHDIDASISPPRSWRSSPIPSGRRSVSPTHY